MENNMLDPVRAKLRLIGFTMAAFFGGVLLASGMEWTAGSHASLLQTGPPTSEVQPVAELSEAFVAISESVTPAVVNIRTERTQQLSDAQQQIPEQFRRFFRLPPGGAPPGSGTPGSSGESVPVPGGGTGFLISSDGHIMTNNHVVQDAQKITVILQDRREFAATVVGRDPTTDVAVIRIEGSDFPAVRLGDPESTRVGEWVLAIGNPLGLDFSVTAGIVSAKGRPLSIIQSTLDQQGFDNPGYAIESFIQTDAAINPGNSGGPLVNLRGEVIGINSVIASNTGFNEGYGFAVPIDLARRVADDLIRYGQVRRPILGVSIQGVTVEDREAFNLPSVAGAVVQGFSTANSPAEQAGLEVGDVIVGLNGVPIVQSNDLQRRIAGLRPGDRVRLEVIRYGERLDFTVRLGEASAELMQPVARPVAEPVSDGRLGLRVVPLTDDLARRLQYGEAGGVVIENVQPYGAADRRGVVQGERVLAVDRQGIETVADFERVIRSKSPGEVVSLTLGAPGGATRIVNIRVPE
jgi:serine protease Do